MNKNNRYLGKIDLLNEVYTGKIPEVLSIEEKIRKARQKYLVSGNNRWEEIKGTTNDKDIDAIGKEIAKTFGFYSCVLLVYPDVEPNAGTSPITYAIDMIPEEHVIPYKGGYKYDNKLKYCTFIMTTTAVFCNPDYTDAEITAILLHEVGHNFIMTKKICLTYKSFRDTYELLKMAEKAGQLTAAGKADLEAYEKYYTIKGKENTNNELRNEYIDVDDSTARYTEKQFTKQSKSTNIFNAIVAFFGQLDFGIFDALSKSFVILFVNSNVDKEMNGLTEELIRHRSMEYLADSFAAVYGYGPELSSGLYKLETGKNRILDIARFLPWTALFKKILQVPYISSIYLIADHPNSIARMNNILNNLKAEVKKEKLDDKTKQCLLENIAQIEELQKEITSYQKKWKFFDKYHYAKTFLALATKRGDAPSQRELDYASSKEIDKFYDGLLKKKK